MANESEQNMTDIVVLTRAHVTKYMIYSQVLQHNTRKKKINKSNDAEIDDDDDVRISIFIFISSFFYVFLLSVFRFQLLELEIRYDAK